MKKVFKPMLVLAFITLVSYNVYSSQQEVTVSDLALSNAEAGRTAGKIGRASCRERV